MEMQLDVIFLAILVAYSYSQHRVITSNMAQSDEDAQIEMFKVKKLIKSLTAARGYVRELKSISTLRTLLHMKTPKPSIETARAWFP